MEAQPIKENRCLLGKDVGGNRCARDQSESKGIGGVWAALRLQWETERGERYVLAAETLTVSQATGGGSKS